MSENAESPCLFLLKPNKHTKPPIQLAGFTIVGLEGRFHGSHVCAIDTMTLTVHEPCKCVVLRQLSSYPSSVNGILMHESELKELEIGDVISLLHDEPETSYILTPNQVFVTPVIMLADCSATNLSPKLMLSAELQNLPPKTCIFLHDISSITLMSSKRILEFASNSNALKNARADMQSECLQQKDLDVVVHAINNEVIVRHTFLSVHHTSIRYELPDTELLHIEDVEGYCGCNSFRFSKNAAKKLNLCKHLCVLLLFHFYSDGQLLSFLDGDDGTTCRASATKKMRK